MAYGPDDVLRSFRRYVALALPDYTLRLERREVATDPRPKALLEMGDSVPTRSRAGTLDQGVVTQAAPLTVTLYPDPGADGREGSLQARRDVDLLRDALILGLVDENGDLIGAPFRVPLLDWAGVPVTGAGRGLAGELTGYLWVGEDVRGRVIQDAEDPALFSAPVNVNLSWDRPGRIPPTAPTVTSLPPISQWGSYYQGSVSIGGQMGTFSDTVANGILDAIARNVSFAAPAVWVKLHTGDPGSAGTSNAAAETTRKQATFGSAASGRAISNTAIVEWTNVSTTETYTHVSLWDASTAGTFLGRDDLSSAAPVNAGDTFRLPVGELDLTFT